MTSSENTEGDDFLKHFNLRPMAAALLFFALPAALTGCGQQADEILSLAQEETAAEEEPGTLTDEQTAAAEAENAGTSQEQAASENTGAENVGASDGQGASEDAEQVSDTEDECMAVYICGAVIAPGVYDVTGDMRLVSLVELAGGFAADADETYWNLAQKLDDGAMYYVPTVSETADENFTLPTGEGDTAAGSRNTGEDVSSGGTGSGGSDSGGSADSGQAEGSGDNTGTDGLISINTATQDELTALPGIGSTKAAAIITYRETNGPFTALDEIMNVTGIGESTYEKLKDYICL